MAMQPPARPRVVRFAEPEGAHSYLEDQQFDTSQPRITFAEFCQGDHTFQHALPNSNKVKPWPRIVEKDGHVWNDTYIPRPSFCDVCDEFVWGIKKPQAYVCTRCRKRIHHRCYADAQSKFSCRLDTTVSTLAVGDSAPVVEARYRCMQLLGSGAQGAVMLGIEVATGKEFAVKVIDTRKFAFDPKFAEVLQRELQVLQSIKDVPGIVALHDHYQEDRSMHIVMELIKGGDLHKKLDTLPGNRLEEDEARSILWQVLVTLQQLHRMGITHRDLKPENIMLENVPEPYPLRTRVVDFGLAKISEITSRHTTVLGTQAFMAPEVESNVGGYTSIVDMWSMGAILYQMLSGKLPFSRMDVDRTVTFDDELWDKINPEAKDLINKLLQVDPNERLDADHALQHPWMLQDPGLARVFPPYCEG